MNSIDNYLMVSSQTFKGTKSKVGKFIQKKSHDISIALESRKKGTVKNISGCNVQRYGETDVCQFKTFPNGTKVITNTNGQKRLMTLSGDEVVVNEGGKIRVLSDDTFIKTYEPVSKHWYGDLEYRGYNATAKSGTRSYIDICDRVIGRELKKVSEELAKKGIKLKSYEPACFMYSYDQELGTLVLDVNGKEIAMKHPLETNELKLMRMIKDLFIEGKTPKDFNGGGIGGEYREQFANNLFNEISSKLNV